MSKKPAFQIEEDYFACVLVIVLVGSFILGIIPRITW